MTEEPGSDVTLTAVASPRMRTLAEAGRRLLCWCHRFFDFRRVDCEFARYKQHRLHCFPVFGRCSLVLRPQRALVSP